MKTVYDLDKKILTLTEIQQHFKIDNYPKLVEYVKSLVADGTLIEVKASKSNGMTPPLYNKYRVNPIEEDLGYLADEINYSFPLHFKREFYLNNLQKYQADKDYIEKIIHYFRNHRDKLSTPMSINERSLDIWEQEKFLKEGGGQAVLKNLGLSLPDLNIYTTPEPFVYFSCKKESNQRVLIIENKDTWYTMRRLMIEGQTSFLGQAVDTIIYGSGKNIERSLEEYQYTVEQYLLNPSRVLYWGDIDYEGIAIYERLKKRYSEVFNIELFKDAYITMLELADDRVMPQYSDKQNKNIDNIFLGEMMSYQDRILELLQVGRYIPQEIVNYSVLREE
jgi:hypothetical protein